MKFGFSLEKGKANHPMEDFHVAKFVQLQGHELGLFGIFDGHLGDNVPAYLQKHLFSNIIKEVSCCMMYLLASTFAILNRYRNWIFMIGRLLLLFRRS